MNKLTLQQYFRQTNSSKQNSGRREQDMGLFTFYKQQQQEQNCMRTQFLNQKKRSIKNPKVKSKFKYLKINSSGREQQRSKQIENNKTKEVVAKSISYKMQIPLQKKESKPIDVQNKNESTKDNYDVGQNQGSVDFQKNIESESIKASKFEIEKSNKQRFVSRSLKKIEELLQGCNQKIPANKQKQESNEIVNKRLEKTIKKIEIKEEIVQTINNIGITRNNSRKVCKISLNCQAQEKTMLNTFQKSFLKKIRQNPLSLDKKLHQQKQLISSKTIQNLHDQNKKYFCNLINNFYLPHNENNQAVKILRDTLKFPNLIIRNFNVKTEGNLSPVNKYQKNQNRSVTCKRNFQSNLKDNLKDFKDNQEKTSINDRFKFLLKKQGTKNSFYKAEKLKQKQVSLKV